MTTRSRAGSTSATTGPAPTALLTEAQKIVDQAIKRLDENFREELELIRKEQAAVRGDLANVIDELTTRIRDLEEKDPRAPVASVQGNDGMANQRVLLRKAVNQLLEARTELGQELDLRFVRLSDRLTRAEATLTPSTRTLQLFRKIGQP